MEATATKCNLREFMRFILQQSQITLQSPTIVKFLSECMGLPATKVYENLEKLDLKFIQVKWSDGGRPLALEILRYDVESIPEDKPAPKLSAIRPRGRPTVWHSIMEPRVPKQKKPNPRECVSCRQVKKIVAKNKCSGCYRGSGICIECQRDGNIFSGGKCYTCYSKRKGEIICSVCGKEKVIYTKGKCKTCYAKNLYGNLSIGLCSKCGGTKKILKSGMCSHCQCKYNGPVGICSGCNLEKPLTAKGRCFNCYHDNYRKNRSRIKTDADTEFIIQPT